MLVQAQPPDWLQAALAAQSDTASRMVGLHIAYHWPTRIGGWLLDKVIKVNKDRTKTVGNLVANFEVYYEADKQSAHHLLQQANYAKSSRSKTGAWALVVPASEL